MPGAPDWSRLPTAALAPILAGRNVAVPAGFPTFGPFFVGDYGALAVFGLANTFGNGFRMNLNFFGDQALTQQVALLQWHCTNLAMIVDAVPVFAPWLQVVLLSNLGTPSNVCTYTVTPYGDASALRRPNSWLNLLTSALASLAAGATRQVVANQVTGGQATVNVFTDAAAGASLFVQLDSLRYDGTVDTVFTGKITGTGDSISRTMFVPPATLRLTVRNDGAAAVNVGALITPSA